MKDNPQLQHDLPIWLVLKIKFEGLHAFNTPCRSFAIGLRDQDNPHDDAHLKGENTKESEPSQSTSGNQEQLDDFDFWTDTYATDDDELPAKKVSQELVKEMLEIVDEAKLRKVVDEMLKQRCTLGDEHQYHIDQIKETLHKFPAVIFPDVDIEERTSRWVDKCVKKFNPYARYSVDDFTETGLLWSLLVFIRSTVIWERVHDFQLVLEGLTSYNNDVKHGYVTPSLCKEDVEYLRLFEEEIERLKHHDQMRR
ncbi:hypothetical protein Tco_1246903 [Tanacetum coccineum]